MRRLLTAAAISTLLVGNSFAQETKDPKEEKEKSEPSPFRTAGEKVAYGLGRNVGSDIARRLSASGMKLDAKILIRGFADALLGEESKLTDKEFQAAFTEYQKQLEADRQKEAKANKQKGEAFLAANAKKPGIKSTKSGLQYQVLKAGTGDSPKRTDTVVTNYRGTLLDGTEFDSSYKRGRPATFAVNGVIKGWTEALQLMKVGGKWKLYVPSDLAYGDNGAGELIKPGATLVFEVELLEIKKPANGLLPREK
jgi:FKBP-type peptidyl-prolyl cis-trans isomerase